MTKQADCDQCDASAKIPPENEDTGETDYKQKDLDALLRNQIKLPSLPTIFSQIVELMSDPNSSANDFSDVISKDPSLTARLLKIVNSVFYGYRSKVDTISQAVLIIGTNELYALCLSTSVLTMFKNIPSTLVNMTSFWKHSIGCGIVAKKIAAFKKEANLEKFFVAGLLHDIGRLIIYNELPGPAHKAISLAGQHNELLYNAETEILGFHHAKIGGRLMNKWKLPSKLDDMIQFHHHPENASEHSDTAIIHISDIIINALKFGSSGEQFVPPLNPIAWKTVGLPAGMLPEIVQETASDIDELSSILIPSK
jgi:putative nucleotidyltransferase with HDIG domain